MRCRFLGGHGLLLAPTLARVSPRAHEWQDRFAEHEASLPLRVSPLINGETRNGRFLAR